MVMCFQIHPNITNCNRRRAWKIVCAPFVNSQPTRYTGLISSHGVYEVGTVTKKDAGPSRWRLADTAGSAMHGIYVYLSRRYAQNWQMHNGGVLIEVAIDPNDFLHMSEDRKIATYRKVKTLKVCK
jgi:hypothetical protein